MARGMKVKIEGLRELDRALGQLPKATGKSVLRRVLKEAGEPIARAARDRAPKLELHLVENIDVGTKLTRRQAALHRKTFADDRASAEVFVGAADPAGVQQEFGNERHPPQPFMRPAWDATKRQALHIIEHLLWTEIDKAAQRQARKAAKAGK
ncbi:HK97-gp10 family putative phage morphogenesis protein [Chelativorans sp. J32]|jgi:phage protein, HK97 gp10 family|uniref:HK97-gp10 family putative phage morphogenesis protein n=1 Tax=Chelativorans sp. J32 TaxID=935840 RepID=UPI0004B4398A|nr:HK97-gp10 family putative phage morphogenesis protein [Chelativorans sp. J32]